MSKLLDMARELVTELEKKENESKIRLSEVPVGGKFVTDIGKFLVLEQLDGAAKVITEELYLKGRQFDDDTADYKESKMRELCEGEICEEFSEVFGAGNIIEHEVDLTTVDTQKKYGTCKCKVRLITFDEARQYNAMLVNEELPDWYWTCTAWSTAERGWKYSVAVVSPSGSIYDYSYYNNGGGVRPVCILKSNIFVSKED